mgnify:CR=1 FL=1
MIFNRPRRREKKGYTYRFRDLTYIKMESTSFDAKFRSGENKSNFITLVVHTTKRRITQVVYKTEDGNPYDAYLASYGGWTNEAYRTVTFDEEPTGELLGFLQSVATPQ